MLNYVIDTSSHFVLLSTKHDRIADLLDNLAITDLTLFEIGNVLTKRKDERINNMPIEKIVELSKFIASVLQGVFRLEISHTEITGILATSFDSGVTFYDSSFLYVCRRENLGLVTEDQKLQKKAREIEIHAVNLQKVLLNS